MVWFDYDYHVIDSVQFDITMHHGELTMHCILNFKFYFTYNFVNKYKQSDIWTESLISPAQRKHASWMYQTSNKTKSGHRRQQEHLEQIHKIKYYAYFACLSLLTHLIQIISSSEVCSVHELCSDWHAPYTVSIAPYSLSRGNPLKFTLLQNIHSWFALRIFKHRRVWHHIPLIYKILIHVSHTYMHFEWNTFASNWNHGGISCDVHFAGHLRSNSTNIWSDKRNIRIVQRRGGCEDWSWDQLIYTQRVFSRSYLPGCS